MVFTVRFALVLGLAVSLAACSSSKKSSEAPSSDELTAAEASTDVVPATGPEATPGTDAAAAEPTDPVNPTDPAAPAPADPAVAESQPPVDPAAAPAPAPEPAATQAATPMTAEAGEYTVQEGDTLMKIAFETYGDLYQWKKIYEQNKDKISNPNAIPKGVVLKLERPATPVAVERNGEKYLIKLGDTLGKISDDVYGTRSKWKKIWENNKQMIRDPNRIFAGFYLYYVITPQERQEVDQLKQQRAVPAPLASQEQQAAPVPMLPPQAALPPMTDGAAAERAPAGTGTVQ